MTYKLPKVFAEFMLTIILQNNNRIPEPKDLSLFINKQAKKKSSLCLILMSKIPKIYNKGIIWNQDNLFLIRLRVSLGLPHTLEMMSVRREPQIG